MITVLFAAGALVILAVVFAFLWVGMTRAVLQDQPTDRLSPISRAVLQDEPTPDEGQVPEQWNVDVHPSNLPQGPGAIYEAMNGAVLFRRAVRNWRRSRRAARGEEVTGSTRDRSPE